MFYTKGHEIQTLMEKIVKDCRRQSFELEGEVLNPPALLIITYSSIIIVYIRLENW